MFSPNSTLDAHLQLTWPAQAYELLQPLSNIHEQVQWVRIMTPFENYSQGCTIMKTFGKDEITAVEVHTVEGEPIHLTHQMLNTGLKLRQVDAICVISVCVSLNDDNLLHRWCFQFMIFSRSNSSFLWIFLTKFFLLKSQNPGRRNKILSAQPHI